jgi:hypothetical protein
MIGFRPARPVGTSPEALFAQAVWDKLWGSESRVGDVSGARTQRTTRGTHVIQTGEGKAKPSNDCPYG